MNNGVESERRHRILRNFTLLGKSTFAGGQWGHERPEASEIEAAARRRNARWLDIFCPTDLRSEDQSQNWKSYSARLRAADVDILTPQLSIKDWLEGTADGQSSPRCNCDATPGSKKAVSGPTAICIWLLGQVANTIHWWLRLSRPIEKPY